MPETDRELLERIRTGDADAFEQLVERYGSRVYSTALRLTGNPQDAEEVLQDVFLTVHSKLKDLKSDTAFPSWLYRVTVNSANMKMRRDRRERALLAEEAGVQFDEHGFLLHSHTIRDWRLDEEDAVLKQEAQSILEGAIAELDEKYRNVLVLCDIEGLPVKEAADILEVSLAAAKSRLHRARLFLRHKLDDYFSERNRKWGKVG